MVFESLVVDLINKFLGDYVENLDRSQLKLGIWGGKILEKPVFVARFENWCWMMQMRVWCKYTYTCLMRITLLCWKMTTDFKHEFWHMGHDETESRKLFYDLIWFLVFNATFSNISAIYPCGTSNDAPKQIIVCYRLTIDCCFKISA